MIPVTPYGCHLGPTSAEVIRDIFNEIIVEWGPHDVVDLTYGNGTFWNWDDAPCPVHDADWDFRAVPQASQSWPIVVFDPPFSSMGTASDGGGMAERYGSNRDQDGPQDIGEVHALLTGGIAEATRIAEDWVIVKTQDVVERSQLHSSVNLAINTITNHGFDIVREVAFLPHRRAQPSGRRVTGRGGRPSWFIVARRNLTAGG